MVLRVNCFFAMLWFYKSQLAAPVFLDFSLCEELAASLCVTPPGLLHLLIITVTSH